MLGKGKYGKVYKGVNYKTQEIVAIKVIPTRVVKEENI